MGKYASAVAACKAEFERYLTEAGTAATWRHRTSAVPDSGGEISDANGRADPYDSGYTLEEADETIYDTQTGTVLVLMGDDAQVLNQDTGAIVGGLVIAHCAVAHDVTEGDLLAVSGQRWYVEQAKLADPALYRMLTLRRM